MNPQVLRNHFHWFGYSVFFILIKLMRGRKERFELCIVVGAKFGEVRFEKVPRSFLRHEEISARLERKVRLLHYKNDLMMFTLQMISNSVIMKLYINETCFSFNR